MTSRGSPYQTTPKHIIEFSKALATEIRTLLQEVGKLREDRRQLQIEIAELMAMRSKNGGEIDPNWRPALEAPPMPMALEAPPPHQMLEDIAPARPGWRTVPKKVERRRKIAAPPPPQAPPAAIAPPPGPAMFEHPPNSMPAWAQWRPNPLLAIPTSHSPAHGHPHGHPHPHSAPTPPPRQGLFGASTPPPGGR
ncbi:hypothetical protein FA15DRAFT_671517 [Coprinopsis marcescibilis]|uniref:Uncharacterized protein n=1 Tax=Coprinopsis marcescibilis TaxID=230819 RepID=A0A5C3KQB7_COPMA|nr:hypothetical protein FA15DRAFT_671517 [Coprinopsis marcescibilis]